MVNSGASSYFLSYLVSFSRYAPALRQLRQVAFLVAFPSTIPGRLATRLLEVILSFIRSSLLISDTQYMYFYINMEVPVNASLKPSISGKLIHTCF